MNSPERLTIDLTVAFDLEFPERERHRLAQDLFALYRSGFVELEFVPQGFRLDVVDDLANRLLATLKREQIPETPQLPYASNVTYPSSTLFPGYWVPGFRAAWQQVITRWNSDKGKPPQEADSWHVESHVARERDVFLSDDRRLCEMCRQLRVEHGISIVAMGLRDYFEARRA